MDNQVVPILCLISYSPGNHLVISVSLWARGAKKIPGPGIIGDQTNMGQF